jgi:hypothetical protein
LDTPAFLHGEERDLGSPTYSMVGGEMISREYFGDHLPPIPVLTEKDEYSASPQMQMNSD